MRRSLLWLLTLSLPVIFLGLLAYLLRDSVIPLNWSDLKASDLINIGALAVGFLGAFVAIGSLFVAVSQLQQAAQDGREQKRSLDQSRDQLQAVINNLKDQQEVLGKNLETSKAVLALQQEQQTLMNKSVEISKDLLALQKEQWKREQDLANQKPHIQVLIGDQVAIQETVEIDIQVARDNKTTLPLRLKNTGSASLKHPVVTVSVPNTPGVAIALAGSQVNIKDPYRSQVSGIQVLDLQPFSSAERIYDYSVHMEIPDTVKDIVMLLHISGDNLTPSYKLRLIVRFIRS
jgi:hypothetical protein